MIPQDQLRQLLKSGDVEQQLKRKSRYKVVVRALQTLLHELGFDAELQWARYGADGDYGGSTAAAVKAFSGRNGISGNGDAVTKETATAILRRRDNLEELQHLYDDVQTKRVEATYFRRSTDTEAVASLQTLLHDLGFDKELNWARYGADGDYGGGTTKAVVALAAQQGLASDGTPLSLPLAQRILDLQTPHYGPGWARASEAAAPSGASLTISEFTRRGKGYVRVSDGTKEKVFGKFKRGLFTRGDVTPLSFVTANKSALQKLGFTDSAINVMISVSENEGNLDAINTWDNAYLSFGMFQWTAGVKTDKGELAALLKRVKDQDAALFKQYYGRHGIDVTQTNETYGYLVLNGKRLDSPASKTPLRAPSWAFYFWLAGQDTGIQAIETQHALARLNTFYTRDSYKVGKYYVSDLVTSEYGVALILDNHVNRPAYVKACLSKAMKQTKLSDPKSWSTQQERQLIDAYLKIRETYGRSPMTDAKKRAEVTKKYLINKTISDARGSFKNPFS